MIFDEPTAGLDPVGVKEVLDILTNLHKNGKTIINVTHDLDHARKSTKSYYSQRRFSCCKW